MTRRRHLLSLVALRSSAASPSNINVAAASNLTSIANNLASAAQREIGVNPVFSFASTAQLAKQIEEGAPFDLLLAADAQHVDELIKRGRLLSGSRAVYATGILTLWFPRGDGERLEDITRSNVRTIAVARPELAPYGAAAVETLRASRLWDRIASRVVYAGSVAMAKQYGATGNADAAFLPKALLMKDAGTMVTVDPRLYKPIEQVLGVVKGARQAEPAGAFARFLSSGAGRTILQANGYK